MELPEPYGHTSPDAGPKAARMLLRKGSTPEQKSVAGSALAQRRWKKRKV